MEQQNSNEVNMQPTVLPANTQVLLDRMSRFRKMLKIMDWCTLLNNVKPRMRDMTANLLYCTQGKDQQALTDFFLLHQNKKEQKKMLYKGKLVFSQEVQDDLMNYLLKVEQEFISCLPFVRYESVQRRALEEECEFEMKSELKKKILRLR